MALTDFPRASLERCHVGGRFRGKVFGLDEKLENFAVLVKVCGNEEKKSVLFSLFFLLFAFLRKSTFFLVMANLFQGF